jgi:hypothetical protein
VEIRAPRAFNTGNTGWGCGKHIGDTEPRGIACARSWLCVCSVSRGLVGCAFATCTACSLVENHKIS